MNPTQPASQKVQWPQVAVYYLIACAISWPFFWWRDILHWEGFHGPNMLKTVAIMWGPGVAGLVCLFLFRKSHVRTVSFFGSSWVRSLIFWFGPILLLAALGAPTQDGPSHTLPLMLSVFFVFTVLGEEVGWRGFLQDALRPIKPFWRYVLIGVLWEAWHFTNRTHDKTLMQIALTLPVTMSITSVLSWLMGMAVERSKSILVAAAIHGWIDMLFEFQGLNTYICAGVALILWLYLLRTWPAAKTTASEDPGAEEIPG